MNQLMNAAKRSKFYSNAFIMKNFTNSWIASIVMFDYKNLSSTVETRLFLIILLLSSLNSTIVAQSHFDVKFTNIDAGKMTTDTLATASATWVDIDNDGYSDLYVANGYGVKNGEPVANPNFLFKNDGDGTFSAVEDHPLTKLLTFSGNSTWADIDNDGDLDVFIANQMNKNNELYIAEPNGNYRQVTTGDIVSNGGKSFSSIWVDMDNDGLVDLHVLNGGVSGEALPDFVYKNKGNGTFERLENISLAVDSIVSGGAAWGDYDKDGDMDVIIPLFAYKPQPVFKNEGNWQFSNATDHLALSSLPLNFNPLGSVAAWIDVNNDLNLDFFRGTVGGYPDFLYLGNGKGQFEKITEDVIGTEGISTNDVCWGDFDNDGDLDMISSPWGSAAVYYENDGSGKFSRKLVGDLGKVVNFTSGIAPEDYDNDGDLDLFITHWDGAGGVNERNQLYRNDTKAGNWLKVKLEGTQSNRSAIGATIILTATINGRVVRQLRYVNAKTSWRASSSLMQHFGLGDAISISEIRIEWPSGRKDILTESIKTNQTIHVIEGKGILKQ